MANNVDKNLPSQRKERDSFLDDLKRFHHNRGTPFQRFPYLRGQEVDLYLLYNKVTALGGWEKVNDQQRWQDIQTEFHLPKGCTNAAQALRDIYIRYLDVYEKIHHFGEDPDRKMPESEEQGLPGRRKKVNYSNIVPLSYNHNQHHVANNVRETAGLAKPLEPGMASKLEKALMSGLPNEMDFAVNVCTLLSSEGKHTLQLEKCPRLLKFLLGHIGIFDAGPSSLKTLHLEGWKPAQKRNFLRFWWESIEDHEARKLICPDVPLNETDTGDNDHCPSVADVLCLSRGLGLNDKEGQRVLQVGMIVRNLSFEVENMKVLSSDNLVLRFLMLCMKCKYHSIRQMALDTLGNIAIYINLKPPDCLHTPFFFSTLSSCIQSHDKFEVVTGLDVLARFCQKETNEEVICEQLTAEVYQSIVSYLTVHDIQLIVYTLECLYQLSELGEITTSQIAQVTRAVASLVSLVTIEAQSYGPESIKGIKVVEHIPAGMQGITSQPPPEAQASTSAGPVVKSGVPQKAGLIRPTAVPTPPPHAMRPPVSATPPPSRGTPPPETDPVLIQWLQSNYEGCDISNSVSQMELYAGYIRSCPGIKRVPDTRMLTVALRVCYPRIDVKKIQSAGKTDTFVCGIRKRDHPLPFSFERSSTATPPPTRFQGNMPTPTPSPPNTPHLPKSSGKLKFHQYRPTPPNTPTPPPVQQHKQATQFPMPPPRPPTPQSPQMSPSMLQQALMNKHGTTTPTPSPAQPPTAGQLQQQQPPNLIKSLLVKNIQNMPLPSQDQQQGYSHPQQQVSNLGQQQQQQMMGNQGQAMYSNQNNADMPQQVISNQQPRNIQHQQQNMAVVNQNNIASQNNQSVPVQNMPQNLIPQQQMQNQGPVNSFQQHPSNMVGQQSQMGSMAVGPNQVINQPGGQVSNNQAFAQQAQLNQTMPQNNQLLIQQNQSFAPQGQINQNTGQNVVSNQQGQFVQQPTNQQMINQGQMGQPQFQGQVNQASQLQQSQSMQTEQQYQVNTAQTQPQNVQMYQNQMTVQSQPQMIQIPQNQQMVQQGQMSQGQGQIIQQGQGDGQMVQQGHVVQGQGQIVQQSQNQFHGQQQMTQFSQNQQGQTVQGQPVQMQPGQIMQVQQGQGQFVQMQQGQFQPVSQRMQWSNNTQGQMTMQQAPQNQVSQGQTVPSSQAGSVMVNGPGPNQWQTNHQFNPQFNNNQVYQNQGNWQNPQSQFGQQPQQFQTQNPTNWQNQFQQFTQQQNSSQPQPETGGKKKKKAKSPRTKSPKPKGRKSKANSLDSADFNQTSIGENDLDEDDGYVCSAVADVVDEIHQQNCRTADLLKENQPPETSSKIPVVVEQLKDNLDGAKEITIEKVENTLNTNGERSDVSLLKSEKSEISEVVVNSSVETVKVTEGATTVTAAPEAVTSETASLIAQGPTVDNSNTQNNVNVIATSNSNSQANCDEKTLVVEKAVNGLPEEDSLSQCSETNDISFNSSVEEKKAKIARLMKDTRRIKEQMMGTNGVGNHHSETFSDITTQKMDTESQGVTITNCNNTTISKTNLDVLNNQPVVNGFPETKPVNGDHLQTFHKDISSKESTNCNVTSTEECVMDTGVVNSLNLSSEDLNRNNNCNDGGDDSGNDSFSLPPSPSSNNATNFQVPPVSVPLTENVSSLVVPPSEKTNFDNTASNTIVAADSSSSEVENMDTSEVNSSSSVIPTQNSSQIPQTNPSVPFSTQAAMSTSTSHLTSSSQNCSQFTAMNTAPLNVTVPAQPHYQVSQHQPSQPSPSMKQQPVPIQPRPVPSVGSTSVQSHVQPQSGQFVISAQQQQLVQPQLIGTQQPTPVAGQTTVVITQGQQQQQMAANTVASSQQGTMQLALSQSLQPGQVMVGRMVQGQVQPLQQVQGQQQQMATGQNMVPQTFFQGQANQQNGQMMLPPNQQMVQVQGMVPSQTVVQSQSMNQFNQSTIVHSHSGVAGQQTQAIVQNPVLNQGQVTVQSIGQGQTLVQGQMMSTQGQTVIQSEQLTQGQTIAQNQPVTHRQIVVQQQPVLVQSQSTVQGQLQMQPVIQGQQPQVLHPQSQGQTIVVQNQIPHFVQAPPMSGGQVQQVVAQQIATPQTVPPQSSQGQYLVQSGGISQQQMATMPVQTQQGQIVLQQSYQGAPLQLPSPVPTPPPASPQGSVCSSLPSPAPPTGSKKKRPSSRQSNKSDGDKSEGVKPKKKRKSRSKSSDSGKGQLSPGAVAQQQTYTVVQSPQPPPPITYMCEWNGCNCVFDVCKSLQAHAQKTHYDFRSPSGLCHWQGCDKLIRQKWSLITHIQEKHLNEPSLQAAALRRQQMATSPGNPQPGTPAQPVPPPVYPMDAAVQAIKRFCPKPPYPEFTELKEGPVTKHIRLTSALILRNMARYSALGRCEIKKHENHLAYVALSPVESSAAISNCLYELHKH